MPLYEYECDACHHRFEVIQKFSDPPIEVCPKCGSAVHKLQSAPAFQFKGTGWYVTDYAKSGADSKAGKDGADSKAGKDDADSKTGKDGADSKAAKDGTDSKAAKEGGSGKESGGAPDGKDA